MLLVRLLIVLSALAMIGLMLAGWLTGKRIYIDRAWKLGKLVVLALILFFVMVSISTYA